MSTLLDRARAAEPLGIDIIDMHGHLGRLAFAIPDLSPEGLVASMDRLGIRTIVCSHMRCMSRDVEYGNAEVLRAVRACPGRILGYVSVYPSDPDSVRRGVEKWLAAGLTGLKMHNINGFPYTDPAYAPALAIADERRLPVLLHTWGQDDEFEQVRALSERHPGAALLLAHSGATNEDRYIAIVGQCPNVHLELCGSASAWGQVARFVAAVGADKLVWGSDAYFISNAQQLGKVVGADIPDETKVQILSANALRILDRIRP